MTDMKPVTLFIHGSSLHAESLSDSSTQSSDIRIGFFSFSMESDLERLRNIRPYYRQARKDEVNEKSQ